MERIVQVMDEDPDKVNIMKMWKNFNIPVAINMTYPIKVRICETCSGENYDPNVSMISLIALCSI